MTVRNDQPPLSRRELRDRSRARTADDAPPAAAGDSVGAPTSDAPPAELPTAEAPPADASTAAAGLPGIDETPSVRPARERRSPFAPRSNDGDAAGQDMPSPAGAPDSGVVADEDDHASHEPAAPAGGGQRPLPSDLAAPERTMTRRELRILRERAEAAGEPAPDVVFLPSGEATVTGMIPLVDAGRVDRNSSDERREPNRADDAAPSEDDSSSTVAPEADPAGVVTEEPVETSAAPAAPAASDQPVIPALIEPLPTGGIRFRTDAGRPEDIALPVTASEQTEPLRTEHLVDEAEPTVTGGDDPQPEIVVDAEPATGPVTDQGREAPGPITLTPFDAMFRPPFSADPLTPPPVESVDTGIDMSAAPLEGDSDDVRSDILSAPEPAARSFGHWSTQSGDDEDADPRAALSRDVGVGTGAITTHALVLPSIPDASDPLLSPLTSTGEIMVTGTIDLPRTYGSTGAHPALFDHPDVDALLDDSDREDAESAVAPVRASRAVSSTTTTRAMIGSDEAKKSRWLPIVLISAGVIFVAAAAFVIAAFIFNPG